MPLVDHDNELLGDMRGLHLTRSYSRGKGGSPHIVNSPHIVSSPNMAGSPHMAGNSGFSRDTMMTRSSTTSDYSDRSSWANSQHMSTGTFYGSEMDMALSNSGNVTPITPSDGQFSFEDKHDYSPVSRVPNERAGHEQYMKRKTSKVNSLIGNSLEASLAQIVYLDLSTSSTTSQMISSTGRLPRWLQKCTNLKYLIAKDVGLRVVDDWVSSYLVNLKVLRLDNNDISTWPDHLVRLVAYGKLMVLSLEGNPCLVNLVKRSQSFKDLYMEPIKVMFGPDHAAKYEESALVSKTPKDKQKEGKMSRFLKTFRKDKGLLISEHSVTMDSERDALGLTATMSNIANLATNAFNEDGNLKSSMASHPAVQRYSPAIPQTPHGDEDDDDDDDDDDMLTSLGPTRRPTSNLRKHSSAANLQKTEHSHAVDTATNMSIEPLEVAKTKIVLALLQNILELNLKRSIAGDVPSFGESPLLTSSPTFHSRANSSSEGSRFHVKQPSSHVAPTLRVFEEIQESVLDYHAHVRLLGEWDASYSTDNCKKDLKLKANKLFAGLKELLDANKRILPLMVASVERVKQGFDPNYDHFFRAMSQTLDEIIEPIYRYAETYEQNRKQARVYLQLNKATTSSNYYGSAASNYVPSDHQDLEIAEWLRSCAKKSTHTLDSALSYMDEPFKYLDGVVVRCQTLLDLVPTAMAQLVCTRISDIQREVEARRPKALGVLKKQELVKLFKIKADYGQYLNDVNLFIEGTASLGTAKTNDVIYYEAPDRTVPRCFEFKLNDKMRPTRGQSMRMIVFSEATVFIDENRQAIYKVCKQESMNFSKPLGLMSSQPETGLDGEIAKRLMGSVRIAFYDKQEIWYSTVKSYSGTCVRRNNETTTDVFLRAMGK